MSDDRPENEKRNERIRNLIFFKMYATNDEAAQAAPGLIIMVVIGGLVWAGFHYLS